MLDVYNKKKGYIMNILITGASSGIGYQLALDYARNGNKLYLIGRNKDRLQNIEESIKELGAEAKIFIVDVCDKVKMSEVIDSIGEIDLAIANAGISTGTLSISDAAEGKSRQVLDTNIWGVVNTVYPVINIMKKRKSGQIAIISSMAGFRGLCGASAYCSSKAFARVFGESLQLDLKKYGIAVNIICPGWIKTPLTDANNFKMPLLMPVEKASKIIIKSLEKNKPLIKFPLRIYYIVRILEMLPMRISNIILNSLPKK